MTGSRGPMWIPGFYSLFFIFFGQDYYFSGQVRCQRIGSSYGFGRFSIS